jgi:bacteriocin-like protein
MDMNHELNINELDAVSGGLQRIPAKDAANQRSAAQNDGSHTVGGSIGGQLVGSVAEFGCAATGGHPFDY